MNVARVVGKVITPQEELPRSLITLEGGRIRSVEPWGDRPAPPGALDAGDGWIAPGFIDLQVNGAYGHDLSRWRPDLDAVARCLASHGVTGFLPTLVSLPLEMYFRLLPDLRQRSSGGARALGVHLEGPFLSARYRGAHRAQHLCAPDRAILNRLLDAGPVRLVTIAPELPGAMEIVRYLVSRGVVVSLGHSGASYEEAVAALDAGARMGTHLFNAMPPLHHRDPGLAGAILTDSRAVAGVIADGVHLHPVALRLTYLAKGAGAICLATDCTAAAGMPPGKYTLGDQTVIVDGASARLADGTLAGSVLVMDRAIRNMFRMAGCSLAEAVEMASLTPARVMGLDGRKGRVAPGCDADIVVLGPDMHVRATLVGGELVYGG